MLYFNFKISFISFLYVRFRCGLKINPAPPFADLGGSSSKLKPISLAIDAALLSKLQGPISVSAKALQNEMKTLSHHTI